MKKIIMYSAPWCGDCKRSEALLEHNGVVFEKKDIESDPAAQTKFLALVGDGPRSIPRILFQRDQPSAGEPDQGMHIIETLIEPSNHDLISALATHGFISTPQPV